MNYVLIYKSDLCDLREQMISFHFKMFLKTDFNKDVSEKRILNLLKQDPNYLIHQRRQRNYPLRSYDVQAFGEVIYVLIT